jgi:hypothetical protein
MWRLVSASVASRDQDPFRLLRLAAGGILLFATLLALALWLTGVTPRAILLIGAFWALYGLVFGLIDGVLEPVIGFLAEALQNVGLVRYREGYSGIETLAAQGLYDAAANEYLERAAQDGGNAEALIRRAALLAGPLKNPGMAVMELHNFRDTHPLGTTDDIKVGLTLVNLYERSLDDAGHAMTELRRLIDLHPGSRAGRRIRRMLAELRREKFGADDEDPKEPPT